MHIGVQSDRNWMSHLSSFCNMVHLPFQCYYTKYKDTMQASE